MGEQASRPAPRRRRLAPRSQPAERRVEHLSPEWRRAPLALALLGAPTAAAGALPASACAAGAVTAGSPTVVLAFLPTDATTLQAASARGRPAAGEMAAALGRVSGLSVGIMSATEGRYTTEQLLLDITQGARVASSAYARARPPALALRPVDARAVVGAPAGP